MTERDYLHYEMNKDEMDKWEQLVADIKKSFISVADISVIPLQLFSDVLERTTMAKEPWNGCKVCKRNGIRICNKRYEGFSG